MRLLLSGTFQGEVRTWTIERSPARIGRSSSNAVQLQDASVSREHAELMRDGEAWLVRDLGSRNGCRVNAEEAAGGRPVRPGDWLEIGHVMLRVGSADAPAESRSGRTRGPGETDSSLRVRVSEILERPVTEMRDPGRLVRLLSEAGRLLVLPRPLAETCEQILGLIERAIPASRLVILMSEGEPRKLVPVAGRYRDSSASEPLRLPQSIVRLVMDEQMALLTDDAAADDRFAAAESVIGQRIHSAMAVPLFEAGHVHGLLYADSTRPSVIFEAQDLELLTLLANMAAVRISNARLLDAEEERRRLAQELAAAAAIQAALLPDPPASAAGWSCAARLEHCREVGGDFYDFHLRRDGHLVLLVGDVAGKGMPAALLMSSAIASARALLDSSIDPGGLVRELNRVLSFSADRRSFLTLFAAQLDPRTGVLHYVNAGHPAPLIVAGERQRELAATGIPVGVLEDFEWSVEETLLEPGDVLAVFTDGIPETRSGERFFDSACLADALRGSAPDAPLEQACDAVLARVHAFAEGAERADDVTLVLLRREPVA